MCSSLLEQLLFENVVCWKCAAQLFTRASNRLLYLLGTPVGDGGNVIHREAFKRMQDESFPILRRCAFQRKLYQREHFVGVGNLLRRGCTSVGNAALGGHGLVGLMKLHPWLVTGALIAATTQALQVHI